MNEELTNFEIEAKNTVNSLLEEINDEIMRGAGCFMLNPKLGELNTQLADIQTKCPHKVNEKGYCMICSKFIEK